MGRACRRWGLAGAFLAAAAMIAAARAADPPATSATTAIVIDSAGKEVKLTGVKFTSGVRRLAWLADANATGDDKKGPFAVEIREANSTTFQNGVLTLVPLASIESVKYDYAKLTATYGIKGKPEPFVGTCQYKGFSVLGMEGEADGKKTKVAGGSAKTGFKSVAFENAKAQTPRPSEGPVWNIQLEASKGGGSPSVAVRNLKVLFQLTDKSERVLDAIPVRKGNPIKFDGLMKLEVLAVDPTKKAVALGVTSDSGERAALASTAELDGKPATLIGLVGEVDVGWKLFPLHTIQDVKPVKVD